MIADTYRLLNNSEVYLWIMNLTHPHPHAHTKDIDICLIGSWFPNGFGATCSIWKVSCLLWGRHNALDARKIRSKRAASAISLVDMGISMAATEPMCWGWYLHCSWSLWRVHMSCEELDWPIGDSGNVGNSVGVALVVLWIHAHNCCQDKTVDVKLLVQTMRSLLLKPVFNSSLTGALCTCYVYS